MYEGLFKELDRLITVCVFSLFVLVPLSLWKLAEIGLWVYHHLHMSMSMHWN
jgi:hypothetical protein